MKKIITIPAIILFTLAGCKGNKQSTDDLITVDVTASYSKKELILQDFMDVEYIPLETNDEFLCQGIVQDIGKDIIAVKNRVNDGDIFIFDRTGKAIRKINRKGRSREEYANISKIILDEDNGEMFVNDFFASKIVVYDLGGEFKRSFSHKDSTGYQDIYSFDRGNLICHASDWAADREVFMIVSKQDGRVTEEISIPFEKKLSIMLRLRDEASGVTYTAGPDMYPIIPYFDSRILVEPSSDTVYSYLPDHNMIPFITRTPSIQSMNPEIFLFPRMLTGRYYFMESVKKVYDFGAQKGFPGTHLMYDRQEKALFEYTVYNDDYSNKKQVNRNLRPVNDEIAAWQRIEAHQLVDAYKNGELKGKLKEIAAGLEEESNPVIMLVKHKK